MTTKADVLAYIVSEASSADLLEFADAAKLRKQGVAKSLRPGAEVIINGISPKYLNGLKGTVKAINKQRVTVTLDLVSTATVRATSDRFFISPTATTYDLSGIPLTCIIAA